MDQRDLSDIGQTIRSSQVVNVSVSTATYRDVSRIYLSAISDRLALSPATVIRAETPSGRTINKYNNKYNNA